MKADYSIMTRVELMNEIIRLKKQKYKVVRLLEEIKSCINLSQFKYIQMRVNNYFKTYPLDKEE